MGAWAWAHGCAVRLSFRFIDMTSTLHKQEQVGCTRTRTDTFEIFQSSVLGRFPDHGKRVGPLELPACLWFGQVALWN